MSLCSYSHGEEEWSVYTYTYIPTVELEENRREPSDDSPFSLSDDQLFGSSDGMRERVQMCDQAIEVTLDLEPPRREDELRIETQTWVDIAERRKKLSFAKQVITDVVAGTENPHAGLVKIRKTRRKVRRVRVKRRVPVTDRARK